MQNFLLCDKFADIHWRGVYVVENAGEGKNEGINQASDKNIVAGIHRIEKGLPDLFEKAQNYPKKRALAKEITIRCYETIIRKLCKASYIINCSNKRTPQDGLSYSEKLNILRDERKTRENNIERNDVESVNQLLNYYVAALIGVESETYLPETETIIKANTIPEKLLPIIKTVQELRKMRPNDKLIKELGVEIMPRGESAIELVKQEMKKFEGRINHQRGGSL